MKILVLGGAGMLGHQLLMDLSQTHETWATLHGSTSHFPSLPGVDPNHLIGGVDVLQFERVMAAVAFVRPEIVINCIGLVKQRENARHTLPLIDLNARLPHQLALLCQIAGSRLIHISTDCVFSGRKGHYTEADPTDAEDGYGKSKALGEVSDLTHVLTLRTSLIGPELFTGYGLVNWFLSQQGSVTGYQKAIFSGFPTHAISGILDQFVFPHSELWGLYHVSAEPIDKYALLQLLKEAYGKEIEIVPDSQVTIDRSLNSDRFRAATQFAPVDWPSMIERMAGSAIHYESWKNTEYAPT